MAKCVQKSSTSAIFDHIFAIIRCLIDPLVAKLLHILVEQVISFEMNDQNQTTINFRNKQRVIDLDL